MIVETNDISDDETNKAESELVAAKMRELKAEVMKQEMIISQTSQALNLCNSTYEFMGSTEQVEAERVLLLASEFVFFFAVFCCYVTIFYS